MESPFNILEHPSDLGIEAHGDSLKELYRHAALGLTSIIAGTSKIEPRSQRTIVLTARDRENLLVRWLSEILFLYDVERYLAADIRIDFIDHHTIKAGVFGEKYDPKKHELYLDIKAITYHHLTIEEHDGHWLARVYVDI